MKFPETREPEQNTAVAGRLEALVRRLFFCPCCSLLPLVPVMPFVLALNIWVYRTIVSFYGVSIIIPPLTLISIAPFCFGITIIFSSPNKSRIFVKESISLLILFSFSGSSLSASFRFFANKVANPEPIVSSIGTFLFGFSFILEIHPSIREPNA